jgi:hypothetical protein
LRALRVGPALDFGVTHHLNRALEIERDLEINHGQRRLRTDIDPDRRRV